ncbi:MAG: hypothetical protein EOO28_29690 [Comamonadaceae bacterium]|nr:MAG: hypothetical protein EOO28_29690 [Comamonadaceae bacterium]
MILFTSGPMWLSFGKDTVSTLPAFPMPAGPATLLWAPVRGVTGVAALEGNPRHASVLIERRLRSEGSIEGDAKVFIHHFRTIGRGYQALYSVVPLEEWQSLLAWVRDLPDHCLVFPCPALLWAGLRDGEGAVLHDGVQMLFLGVAQGQIVHANVIAFSTLPEDIELAARALGEKVRKEWSALRVHGAVPELPVSWYSARSGGGLKPLVEAGTDLQDEEAGKRETKSGVSGLDQDEICAFAASSGRVVVSKNEPFAERAAGADAPSGFLTPVQTERVESGLSQLARHAKARLALNPSADKWRHVADRLLPACTALCLLSSAALLALSGTWMAGSNQVSSEVSRLAQRESSARQRMAGFASADVMPGDLARQIDFFESAMRLGNGRDVAGLLKALQSSATAEVRILGVRAEEVAKGEPVKDQNLARATQAASARHTLSDVSGVQAFVVDGLLSEAGIGQDSNLLSAWVRDMRSRGYELEAIDSKVPAAGTELSSRLFSYRVQPVGSATEGIRP